MADEQKTKLRLEIAHVLFIDIVAYSKLLIDEQAEALEELKKIVRNTEAVREAETAGQLIRLPTGDGMALVFTISAEAPVECALQISRALREKPRLSVRMGIHSGPVHQISDVNERTNIAGAGINIAQRVMDCGDAGHILLSKHVADDLEQYRQWHTLLHDLGECEVKHGVRLNLVNLYNETAGNPAVPEKIRSALPESATNRATPVVSGSAKKWLWLLAGLLLLALISWLFLLRRPHTAPSFATKEAASAREAAIPDKSIAVLPFENLSSDKENAYFAEGIQDEILTRLSKIADLKVISRTSTQHYKTAPENLSEIGKQLGVAHVVEGSVQKSGGDPLPERFLCGPEQRRSSQARKAKAHSQAAFARFFPAARELLQKQSGHERRL
jgi:class 3 adenylate cyclase